MIYKAAADNLEYFPWAKKRFEKNYKLKEKFKLKTIPDTEYLTLEHTAKLVGENEAVTLEMVREIQEIYAIELGSNLFVFAPSLQEYLLIQMTNIMKELQAESVSAQLAPKDIA